MKIAISASQADPSGQVDPRFGRSPYLIFVDPDTMEFEAVENPYVASSSGAGIQSAQLVSEKGATTVLTGSCGPNAFQTLRAAGVEVIIGVTGTVEEAVRQYKAGTFRATARPNVPSHFGMGGGWGGPGSGFGMGRGMGRGKGRGLGLGPSFGQRVASPSSAAPTQFSAEEEIKYLKEQTEFLNRQLEEISKRIQILEKTEK
ncbi:MAG: NifB/NifX family molybdenum-iron cluster-binding protein [Candidatus Aminicenantales bacterium]